MLTNVDKVTVSESRRELKVHGTPDFPCAAYSLCFTPGVMDELPLHWHEALEIAYVAEGEIELRVPEKTVHAQVGDCFCVNSNVLHYGRALERTRLRVLVFSPELVTGGPNTVFARRYIRPLTESRAFTGVLVRGGEYPEAPGWFLRTFRAMADEPVGFEFMVREELSHLCMMLAESFAGQGAEPQRDSPDDGRVKRMLELIHAKFAEPLNLDDIARAAGVGERECERAFKRMLGMTPKQYIIKYRVTQAASLLASGPELSIAGIGRACGFSNASVFARTFRDYYSVSPREYRAEAQRASGKK